MRKILVYNNRTELADKMRPYLAVEKFEVLAADDMQQLQEVLQQEMPELILLDVELAEKGIDRGVELILTLRELSDIPLIVVSGQTAETAKVMAFESGADDYVTENCNPLELMARIKCQIRRYHQLTDEGGNTRIFRLNGLEVNDFLHTVTVDGNNVRLTPIEYNILKLLLTRRGDVLSNTEIYESIWNMKAFGADNTIAVHVRHIREKIEKNPKDPKYLKAVWGTGYRVG